MSEYLYVCLFSNGHIKVGRSISPKSRIASHADRVACVGIELIEHQVVPCSGQSAPAEFALIQKCAELATKRNKNEWFEGLDFLDVVAAATEFASSDLVFKDAKPAFQAYLKANGRGTASQLANTIGAHTSDLSNWANGQRPVPVKMAVAIELATNKIVTRQDLCPNDWHLIWPELAEKATAA